MARRSLWLVWIAAAAIGASEGTRTADSTAPPLGPGAGSYSVVPVAGKSTAAAAAHTASSFGVAPTTRKGKKQPAKRKAAIPKAKQRVSACGAASGRGCTRSPPRSPTLQRAISTTATTAVIVLNPVTSATCYTGDAPDNPACSPKKNDCHGVSRKQL